MQTQKLPWLLIVGDIAAIAIVTLVGFATHGEVNSAINYPRMLATFVPLLAGWFLSAPFFGLYTERITTSYAELWRPTLVMVLAGPFATVLRAQLLNTTAIPVFTLVLSLTNAVVLTAWRAIFVWRGLSTKKQ